MSPIRTAVRLASGRGRVGIAVTVIALAAGLIAGANGAPDADAKPINPNVPCPQWQELHPGWPCWGNFPEIEEPTGPPTPAVPTPQPATPGPPSSAPEAPPPAAALTPPPPRPAPDPCTAIISVPGYRPPALPGHPMNPPCSSAPEPESEPTPRRVPNPRDLIEPYIRPACGLSPLSGEDVHEIVTGIVGPLEAELGRDDPLVARATERANQLNRDCFGTKNQIKEKVWEEVRDEWYQKFRDRNIKRDRTKKRCDMKDTSKDCEGLVAVCLPKKYEGKLTPLQQKNLEQQRDKYIDAGNELVHATPGNPLVRRKLSQAEEDLADGARRRQRNSDKATYYPEQVDTDKYPSGKIQAGHLPDTTWTGNPDPAPRYWTPMDQSLNGAIGNQAKRYPENYKARAFVPGEQLPGVGCVPRADVYLLRAVPPTLTPY